MTLPVRARLAIVSGGLVAILLAGVGAFLYVRLEATLLEVVDERLSARAASILDDAPPQNGELPGEGDELFAQLLTPDGRVVASSRGISDLSIPPNVVATVVEPRTIDGEIVTAEREVVPARLLLTPAGDGSVLVTGASVDDQREALGGLLALLGLAGPVAVALAGGVGWLVARGALSPVERMRVEAEAVSASEPGRRLPVSPTADELARLGESLNLMLDRLERSAERERRFVADAAHELRTPLANLKAELELALRRARTPEALRESVRSAGEETERLVRLAEDLLVLSRADRGRLPVRREDIEIRQVVEAAIRELDGRAGSAGVSLRAAVPDGLRASLDPLRIRQAVGNLLDNAVRHTPRGGRVTVRAARENGVLALDVSDDGPGFPPEFLAHAFEPFARPDSSRARPDGGAGLGLAIVLAVAEAHGGVVEARNRAEGGAVVELRIPQ